MKIIELVNDLNKTRLELADICRLGNGGSIEYTNKLCALMALQDSLIHALMMERERKVKWAS